MPATIEDLEDVACECDHCAGAAVDLVNINGKFACLECIAQWNGKAACDA